MLPAEVTISWRQNGSICVYIKTTRGVIELWAKSRVELLQGLDGLMEGLETRIARRRSTLEGTEE